MTRAQRLREADALLCAAKHWQNERARRFSRRCRCWDPVTSELLDHIPVESGLLSWLTWASAALSEAARLADDEIVNEEEGT